ncbi:hypothetical protein N431DRAFT_545694 [Stipitochalara longipes BDJ]|nr:hypothetical protein N431DRAFT_545694 [Stipitochalara longipes BDJ]
MRFVVFASLLSLVAAAPVQEEKRQTDDAAPSLAFTGGAYPPAFTPGAFPPEGTFSHRPHGTGSFVRPTGSFTGSFVRPTGTFPHGTGVPPAPVSSALVERDEEAPTGAHSAHARPTGSFTGSFERPTGTRHHHERPTGSATGAFEQPTGTFEVPTGSFTGTFERPTGAPRVRPTGTRVRPSGSGRHGRPTETAAVEPAAPSADIETTESLDVEDPARL